MFPHHCLWNSSSVCLIGNGPLSSSQRRSSSISSFYASFLLVTNGMMSLTLCPHVVSQTPQHLRFSETQATCDGCFACQSIDSDVSFDSSLSRAVHPQEFKKVDVGHWQFFTGLSILLFTFCSKLIESVRMMAWLLPLEVIQWQCFPKFSGRSVSYKS